MWSDGQRQEPKKNWERFFFIYFLVIRKIERDETEPREDSNQTMQYAAMLWRKDAAFVCQCNNLCKEEQHKYY